MRYLTEKDIEEFLMYLQREEKSEATVQKYKRDVLAFMRYADGKEIKSLSVYIKICLSETLIKPQA